MLSRRISPALAFTGTLAVGLAACGSTDNAGPPPPCPRVVKVADAERVTRFLGQGRDVKDVLFEAQIGDIASGCVYVSDNDTSATRIETTMQVQTIASRGPALSGDAAQFQYFVAIARLGQGALARQAFDVEIPLEGNQTRAQSVDELTQKIPLRSGENGDNYIIYVGLVLTPDELNYNRAENSSTVVTPQVAPPAPAASTAPGTPLPAPTTPVTPAPTAAP
jgi:hypothetical protein